MNKMTVVATLMLVGLCVSAKAESKMTASFMPGYAIPFSGLWASNSSDNGLMDTGKNGSFSTRLAADYQFQDSLAVGLELGRDWSFSNKTEAPGTSGGKISTIQATPYVKYFKKFDKWTPYGILGVGFYSVHRADLTDPRSTIASVTYNYLGFNVGGGATYELSKDWELGVDLRWHHIFSNYDTVERTSLAGGTHITRTPIAINNFVPSVKVQYNFSL